jgi:hypothetical protein
MTKEMEISIKLTREEYRLLSFILSGSRGLEACREIWDGNNAIVKMLDKIIKAGKKSPAREKSLV